MTRMTRRALLACGLLFGCSAAPAALAWGVVGHRITGELAEAQLSPVARQQVERLLEGEDEPTLAGVAAWADTVRVRGTAPFHYINLPSDSCRYAPQRDCPSGACLPSALDRFVAVLGDQDAPHVERAEALKWVVHLVGDAHAPLHAGLKADRGGNSHQLQWNGKGTNLHALWDSGMLRSIGGSAAVHAKRLARMQVSAPQADVATWLQESCAITREPGFYPDRHPGPAYLDHWRPVLEARLVQAGQRLAGLLNAVLDP